MNNKTNELQKQGVTGAKYDFTPLINWLTKDIEPEYLAVMIEDIEYNYINFILHDKEGGVFFDAGEHHHYLNRFKRLLKECCKPID
jgi:hypothetical protein